MVRVPAGPSKTHGRCITFGTEQLEVALTATLNARKEGGEQLNELSPFVAPGTLRGGAVCSRVQSWSGWGHLVMKNGLKELQDGFREFAPEEVRWHQ